MGKEEKINGNSTPDANVLNEPVNNPVELDVAGPLTLEEAKAVGDVPEDYQVQPEGILKRATHLFVGDSKHGIFSYAGNPPPPTDSDPEKMIPEELPTTEVEETVKEVVEEQAATKIVEEQVETQEKRVSFADDKAPEVTPVESEKPVLTSEEKAARKKSFLGFLGKKKKPQASTGSIQEENSPSSSQHHVEVAEGPTESAPAQVDQAAAAVANAVVNPEVTMDPSSSSSSTEGTTTETAKPKHKSMFFGNIFHRKKETEAAPIVEEVAEEAIEETLVADKVQKASTEAPEAVLKQNESILSTAGSETGSQLRESSAEEAVQQPAAAAQTVTVDPSTPAQDTTASVKKEKKGGFFGLFRKKELDENLTEAAPTLEAGQEALQETPAVEKVPEAVVGEQAGEEAVGEEKVSQVVEAGEVVRDSATTHPEENRGFFAKLFAKNDQNSPTGEGDSEAEQEENSSATATGAVVAAGVATGAAVVAAVAVATTDEQKDDEQEVDEAKPEEEIPVASVPEAIAETQEATDVNSKSEPTPVVSGAQAVDVVPEIAPDNNVIKVGTAQKKGYFLGRYRLRHVRLMSDGTFQYGKTDDWSTSKSVKLVPSMSVDSADLKTQYPAIVKVSLPKHHPIVLCFKEKGERDSWASVFNEIKQRLTAAQPDNGQAQVIKSSSVGAAAAAGTAQVEQTSET